jgi:mRNA-degrading endonuclease HigB of HigAB toxin-antitoxin module
VQTPADIKRPFASASFVGNNRVVVYIKFIGTHAQYDTVDVSIVDMTRQHSKKSRH